MQSNIDWDLLKIKQLSIPLRFIFYYIFHIKCAHNWKISLRTYFHESHENFCAIGTRTSSVKYYCGRRRRSRRMFLSSPRDIKNALKVNKNYRHIWRLNNVYNVVTALIKKCAKKLPLSRVIVVNCIIIFYCALCMRI